jgi:hypothetical protein
MPMKKIPDRLLVLWGETRNLDQDSSALMSRQSWFLLLQNSASAGVPFDMQRR